MEYPQQIEDRIPPEWGKHISVGKGWYPLLTSLDSRLAEIDPNYTVYQAKEKFGTLRYYIEPSEGVTDESRDSMSALVSEAEQKSESICEECSGVGITSSVYGWYRTLCEPDHEEALDRRLNGMLH